MTYKLLKATPALIRAHQAAYVPTAATEAPCPDKHYQKLNIETIRVTDGEFTMYSTPDSAFFVTKRLVEAAESSIVIGIYDFTARHMRDLLIAAVNRGVEVTLMLDCNFSNNPSDTSPEKSIFNELAEAGVRCVRAPSCQGGTHRFFKVAHEKIIVIDDLWTLIQSGNYSNHSIPFNQSNGVNSAGFKTGNRDMGVAIKSAELASFFSRLIRSDIQLELGDDDEASASSLVPTALPPLFASSVEAVHFDLFPSETLSVPGTVDVLPILTPDNYLDEVPAFIADAQRSIVIQQQYIRNITFAGNGSIRRLVDSIRSAREAHPDLEVRIIVAAPYSSNSDDRTKLRAELDALASVGLLEGQHVRLLNKDHLTHCHNKLVIVDEEKVLISSQNWSEPAVTINREAGVIVSHAEVAGYFTKVFDEDWENAVQSLEDAADTELLMLESATSANVAAVLSSGEFRLVEWGDYADL